MKNKRIAYLDCFSGVAGDMLLAALLGSGVDQEELTALLRSIHHIKDEWKIDVSTALKSEGNISATVVTVNSIHGEEALAAPSQPKNPATTHSHSHDHGHAHNSDSNFDHSHDHMHHDHEHSCGHEHLPHQHDHDHGDSHGHNERNLFTIMNYILESSLPRRVKCMAISAFTELALSEARVHGTTPEFVHFHEVGAIDSIIDTVGVVAALHLLGVTEVYSSPLPMGSGTVWAAHGLMPVPPPATLYLMQNMVLTAGPRGVTGELVTPTGASLVRALCGLGALFQAPDGGVGGEEGVLQSVCALQSEQAFNEEVKRRVSDLVSKPSVSVGPAGSRQGTLPPYPTFRLVATGIGAGKKDFKKHPNILRVMIFEVDSTSKTPLLPLSLSPSLPLPLPSAVTVLPSPPVPLSLPSQPLTSKDPTQESIKSESSKFAEVGEAIVGSMEMECDLGEGKESLWLVDKMVILQCNIDDMTSEATAHMLEIFISRFGARDAWIETISMKKSRVGQQFNVLCLVGEKDRFLKHLFEESSSIGVRVIPIERVSLPRKMVDLEEDRFGTIPAKASFLGDKLVTLKPEYINCAEIATRLKLPLKEVLGHANMLAQNKKAKLNEDLTS